MAHYVTKSSGEQELFNPAKFQRSLHRAGAPAEVVNAILQEVLARPELDTTYKIYNFAFNQLRAVQRPLAARYSLKNALYELGPEGFLFEQFMGELLKALGYETHTDVIAPGLCVNHEIDIVMEKDGQRFMAECKFHNTRGIKSDVKIALYVKARYLDLVAQAEKAAQPSSHWDGVWLITNTQLTKDAIAYGECAGLHMLAWGYPEEGNIAQLIETLGMHPITTITSLTTKQKRFLLEHHILFARELLERLDLLREMDLTSLQISEITEEARALFSSDAF